MVVAIFNIQEILEMVPHILIHFIFAMAKRLLPFELTAVLIANLTLGFVLCLSLIICKLIGIKVLGVIFWKLVICSLSIFICSIVVDVPS